MAKKSAIEKGWKITPTGLQKNPKSGLIKYRRPKLNPSAKDHKKTGHNYMVKARGYWEKYTETLSPRDLVDAFEYLSIAHEELKYANDKEALKEVKQGKKVAKAEILSLLR